MAVWSLGFAHHGGVGGSLYGLGKRGLAKTVPPPFPDGVGLKADWT
jgi:hypothetical protein